MLQIQQRKEESVFDACTMTERQDLNTSELYDFLEEITSVNTSELTTEFHSPFETRDKVYKAKQTDNGDRTTLKKGGTAPPEITLKELVQKLSLYVKQKPDLKKVTNAIERKYRIQTLENDLWPVDDIKRAWGKTQRIHENQKGAWTFVIMYQVMKTYEREVSQLLDKLVWYKKIISRTNTSRVSSLDQCDIGSASQQSSSTENSEKSQPQGDISESHDNTEEIVNAPACLRKNDNDGKSNGSHVMEKMTEVKKTHQPEQVAVNTSGVTSELPLPSETRDKMLKAKQTVHVERTTLQDLQSHATIKSDPIKLKKAIEKKYEIQKQKNDLWPFNDIKQAWRKTQRMHGYSKRRKIQALAVTLQILQSKEVSMYDTSTMTETQCNLKQDLTTSTSDDFNKKYIYKPEQYAPNTSEVTPELSLAKKVKSVKRSLSPVQQKLIGIFKRKLKNLKYQGGMKKTILALFLKHIKYEPSQTTYIRIPLSIMTEELNVGRNVGSHAYPDANIENVGYKLIDEVPSFANTMKKTSYVVKYDHRTRNAAWVFEILNKETLIKASRRPNRFKLDDSIHEYFRGSKKMNEELQRGHLAAAANHNWSQKAMDDTFLFSNMSPQHGSLNTKYWCYLEDYCRKYITDEICTNVYVYTGPLYCPDEGKDEFQYKIVGQLENKDFKAKPTHFFKVIILEYTNGKRELECYMMPNENIDNKKSENEKRLQKEYIMCMKEVCGLQEPIFSEEDPDKLAKLWNLYGEKLFLYKKNLEDIERASGLLFREESLSQDYEEQRVEVNWSAVQEDKHASANVTIYRPTQS
ncbi:uncharacterized protein LOC130556248 [Triplophysa rosa]|uniref:uncharacterized protein LOC130556248 n=1 Tax=Triplophysa rosa TaxID=992332 RepID=UPI002545F018|nr:uncharacterized protein LOC130556248 [Triplophysa rosa]XP_057193017.1 uncharacterized protein LOC130556248 [Triplophysa rosa]